MYLTVFAGTEYRNRLELADIPLDILEDKEAVMPRWDVRFDLPIDVDSPDLVRLVAEAMALARVIRGVPIPPYVRDRLDRLNVLRAVRGTTGIEGSDLSEEEVQIVLDSDSSPALGRPRAREEREVRNAATVMKQISRWLGDDPGLQLSQSLIAQLHTMITQGIDYDNNTPGVYRSHGVRAGSYVPPDEHSEIVRLMQEFEHWLHDPRIAQWPIIIRAVAAHFYFISIHPFGDGNGRTARAIESYLLYQAKVNVLGFYSLSNFYYRKRPEYIEALDAVRFRSGWTLTYFVKFALEGLVEELETVHSEVLESVGEIAFRDLANESLLHHHELAAKVRDRMYRLLLGVIQPARVADIRDGRHSLSMLYTNLSTKTLSRDIQFLRSEKLILESHGEIRANLGLMRGYMA